MNISKFEFPTAEKRDHDPLTTKDSRIGRICTMKTAESSNQNFILKIRICNFQLIPFLIFIEHKLNMRGLQCSSLTGYIILGEMPPVQDMELLAKESLDC